MNILQVYAKGFKSTVHTLCMVTLVYLITLVTGLSLVIPFRSALQEASGMSMNVAGLLKDFDYTTFREVMHFHGDGIRAFMGAGFWVALFFVLIGIFLNGGIVGQVIQGKRNYTLTGFLADGGRWFWRFFRVSLYNLIIQVLVIAIVYVPMVLILAGKFKGGASEPQLFHTLLIFLVIHLIIAVYFMIIADYTRISIVGTGTKKVFKQFWRSLKFVSCRFFGTYGLYLILLVVPAITVYIYFKISGAMHVDAALLILLMLLVQQVFIWLRSGYRVWIFASQAKYYRTHA